MYEVKEKDWKLLRKLVPGWQENYMDKLNKEYMQILSQNESPSTIFWQLEKRIYKDKRHTGVVIDMRRSQMFINILNLLDEGAITMDDLKDFSEELKDSIEQVYRMRKNYNNRKK